MLFAACSDKAMENCSKTGMWQRYMANEIFPKNCIAEHLSNLDVADRPPSKQRPTMMISWR